MSKVYTRYEDVPKGKYHKRKKFKNDKKYISFKKRQSFKSKLGMFYWSAQKETSLPDGSITVDFQLAKKL